jgi:hypothetical protein
MDPHPGFTHAGALWFALSAAASFAADRFGQYVGLLSMDQRRPLALLVAAWFAMLVVAGVAAWRLVRREVYAWLLPLAALNLFLLEPGRTGDARTWRLEWGVMGVAWTLAAAWIFARQLRRNDELERRLHLEGAAIGLVAALLIAVAYALFETRLPPLRASWVAIALLLAWWGGWMLTARRYR